MLSADCVIRKNHVCLSAFFPKNEIILIQQNIRIEILPEADQRRDLRAETSCLFLPDGRCAVADTMIISAAADGRVISAAADGMGRCAAAGGPIICAGSCGGRIFDCALSKAGILRIQFLSERLVEQFIAL